MNKTELTDYLRTVATGSEVIDAKQFTEITVPAELLHEFALKLKEDENLAFDFLVSVTGVDYGKDLGAIYHIRSTKSDLTIVVKVRTGDRENPRFDSVTDIWKSAEFLEREVFDLFGIKFTNHPDLRRLFLDSSWGFPFRKDYEDDVKILTK
jgi:NADH-quinone oxidoreductase subunit C